MKRTICLILGFLLALSPPARAQDVLPPAPEADRATVQTFNAIVYYWSDAQNRLEAIPREIRVAQDKTRTEALLNALLEDPPGENLQNLVSPLPDDTELLSLEESRGVVTVNLSAEFLQLTEPEEQYIARIAIVNTLTATPDIHHVIVLVDGHENGVLDLPVGVWEQQSVNYSADWEALSAEFAALHAPENSEYDQFIQRSAVLYFSSSAGDYLLPEVRGGIRFSPNNYARDLVRELIIGPADRGAMRIVLPVDAVFEEPPTLEQGDEGLILTIPLPNDFYESLDAYNIDEKQAFASIVLTIFSFIPGLDYVRFRYAGNIVESAGDLGFEQGRMRRRDFESMVGQNITLYARGERPGTLSRIVRTVSQQAATRPRTMLRALISVTADNERVFPHGTVNEDIIGIAVEGDQALVNVSAQFQMLMQGISMENERLLIYAIINTLTELPSVKRVRFYVAGEEVDSLGGHLYMRGVFLRNTGMVRD